MLAAFVMAFLAAVGFEVYRGVMFYQDVTNGVASLRVMRDRLDLAQLDRDEAVILADRESLEAAQARLVRGRDFLEDDPLVRLTGLLPVVGKQVDGATALVQAAEQSATTGLDAIELALAFARYEPDPTKTAIEEAVVFLESQTEPLAKTRASLNKLHKTRDTVPGGLAGPLNDGLAELDDALAKLDSLMTGYERAQAFLPALLGYDGERRYLLLPQNNTELFASGGLISSYGILTIGRGRLDAVDLEYFGTLFERWQSETNEYIPPPPQLKNYLKKDYSWGLGEAGWYPDFGTTSALATDFVQKGGAPATDGTIAIDMHFMRALLEFLGPLEVPEYDVRVTSRNFDEVSLELTRDEDYVPGEPRKAFLSYMAREVTEKLLATPKDRWVDMLSLLDRMGRERHLQMTFRDGRLDALSRAYGFGGHLQSFAKDYLLTVDTSVNSTKLNLILETEATLSVSLSESGLARNSLVYSATNPFPEWKAGRDPELVRKLMLDGYYGSYLRIYVPRQARLREVMLDGRSVGAEQIGLEFGRAVFGRFFRLGPGESRTLRFDYESRDVVVRQGGTYVYTLELRKQAGTAAMPINLDISLPEGAELIDMTLDRESILDTKVVTDLLVDRQVEVRFSVRP